MPAEDSTPKTTRTGEPVDRGAVAAAMPPTAPVQHKSGIVVAVQGPVVDVQFNSVEEMPELYEMLETFTFDGRKIILETLEHQASNIARCIAMSTTNNLQYQQEFNFIFNYIISN